MPSKPQPFWRDTSLTIQLVTEPTVETPTLFAFQIGHRLHRVVGAHHQREQQRRAGHRRDPFDGRAFDDEGETRTRAQPDIDAVGRHALLQPGLAAKA